MRTINKVFLEGSPTPDERLLAASRCSTEVRDPPIHLENSSRTVYLLLQCSFTGSGGVPDPRREVARSEQVLGEGPGPLPIHLENSYVFVYLLLQFSLTGGGGSPTPAERLLAASRCSEGVRDPPLRQLESASAELCC